MTKAEIRRAKERQAHSPSATGRRADSVPASPLSSLAVAAVAATSAPSDIDDLFCASPFKNGDFLDRYPSRLALLATPNSKQNTPRAQTHPNTCDFSPLFPLNAGSVGFSPSVHKMPLI